MQWKTIIFLASLLLILVVSLGKFSIPSDIKLAIVTGFFSFYSAAVAIIVKDHLDENRSLEDKGILLISELEGLRIWRQQLCISRFEAFLFSDYHEFRFELTNNPLDTDEAGRWMRKSEDLTLDLAKANQQFLEKLGYVSLIFDESDELNSIIEENRKFKNPIIKASRPDDMTLDKLELWKKKYFLEAKKIIDQEYGDKVERLLKKLKN